MSWLLEKPVAHRGLHSPGIPENTLPAFEAAASAGFPIELDVRRTADGVAAVFHDRTLSRLSGRDTPICECAWKDLRQLAIGGARIPRLEEVLELAAGRVPVLIELKVERFSGADEAAVARALAGRRSRIAVQSFHPLTVLWFRWRYPGIPRGQISCAYDTDPRPLWQTRPLALYAFNAITRPHFLADHIGRLPNRRVASLRRRLPLIVWTIRSQAEADRARQLADNFIFEGFLPT
ncbi:MAG: glycerophosphodiester phosphodiesterase family protein [Terrimicrobiaceae bacterium]|nr:glycerophosphodiester phosphodiesterase family protein [Terrimicrobiaceae bacterium]